MALITVGQTEIEYRSLGSGEPLLFVHGVLVASAFDPLVEQVSLARYRRITYARCGYGRSGSLPAPTSIEAQADDLRGLLMALGLGSAHVVAHSYGGAIALQFALEEPTMVRSLALLEPALILGASGPAYRESLRRSSQQAAEEGPAAAVQDFLEMRSPGYRARMDAFNPAAFDEAVASAMTTFDVELPCLPDWVFDETAARRIQAPVLTLLGARSRELSPRFEEAYNWILANVPRSEGVVIPGATHLMTYDDPGEVAAALAAFLRKLDAQAVS